MRVGPRIDNEPLDRPSVTGGPPWYWVIGLTVMGSLTCHLRTVALPLGSHQVFPHRYFHSPLLDW